MKSMLGIALAMALGVSAAGDLQPPSQASGYTLAFADDFSYYGLATGWSNQGIWWESAAPAANVAVSAGALQLSWTPGQTPATDTSVRTLAAFAAPAYVEIKAKFPAFSGNWPALWLMPVEGVGSAGEHGEIDVMEWQGCTPGIYYGTVHDWLGSVDTATNGTSGKNRITVPAGTNFNSWHVYGVRWDGSTVQWYFDNQPMLSAASYPVLASQHYYLILGQQVGDKWALSPAKVQQTMSVDWVHVWTR